MRRAIVVLLAYLVLVGMIVSPISAASYTLTGYQEFNVLDVKKSEFNDVYSISFDKSADDQAITLIHFKVPQDHQVDFTIYYGTNKSVSGSAANYWELSAIPPTTTLSTITFDGETRSYSYFDTNPEWDYYLSGYARNNTDDKGGLIVYSAGYGSFDNDLAVFKEVPNLGTNLIYRVELSSDIPFDGDISYGSKGDVAASVSKTALDVAGDWLATTVKYSASILGFVTGLFWILKFFFIDNLLLIVAMWISVSMAYSAISSRDIFAFYKKFFRTQKVLIEFIIALWDMLIRTLNALVQMFVKWL